MSASASLATFARGFSCPQEGLDEDSLEVIAVERAREVGRLFLDRHASAIAEAGGALPELLGEWLENELDFAVAWDPLFGVAEETLLGKSDSPPAEVAARLALRMQAAGCRGEWRLAGERPTPVPVRFSAWTLPATEELTVSSDGSEANIRTSGGHSLQLTREDGWWTSATPETCPQVSILDRRVSVLTGEAAATPELLFLADQVLDGGEAGAAAKSFQGAVEVLAAHAPAYLPWIARVMREVVPIRSGLGAINSGSSKDLPGSSHLSIDVIPTAIAEMMVHESTHNYFYLVRALGPVEDGSDERLFYSPIKQRPRPIEYILLAYHAFANVLLLTRDLAESGCPDPSGYLERNESELVPQLAQLAEGLEETTGLTPLGVALWQPLAERIG